MKNLAVLVLSVLSLGVVGCGEQPTATFNKAEKEVVKPSPVKPAMSLADYEEFYRNRAASGNFTATMGLVKSAAFNRYKGRYNRPFCDDLIMRKISKREAVGRLDNYRERVLAPLRQERALPGPEERRFSSYLESLKFLVEAQSTDFAPFLAEPTKTVKMSMVQPVDDFMYIPFGPKASGILEELKNGDLPSSVRSGGVSLFLPPIQADPPLPKKLKIPCSRKVGTGGADGCCHCDVDVDYRENCRGFVNTCVYLPKCCPGSPPWLESFKECTVWGGGNVDPVNPNIDPSRWLDITSVDKIPVGKSF